MFEGREWHGSAGATRQALDELRSTAPADLPESYVGLLAYSDGGEGALSVNPFNLCLDPISDVVEGIRSGNHGQPELDGFLIFGGNGSGEYLAFDLRQGSPWPVVAIDMVAGKDSAMVVAPDFDGFVELIGVDEAVS